MVDWTPEVDGTSVSQIVSLSDRSMFSGSHISGNISNNENHHATHRGADITTPESMDQQGPVFSVDCALTVPSGDLGGLSCFENPPLAADPLDDSGNYINPFMFQDSYLCLG